VNQNNRPPPTEAPLQQVAGLDFPPFDSPVSSAGYRWWYIDGISLDQRYSIAIIAFVGSVFSPYYRRAYRRGTTDPENFCALNVALYGNPNRWSMTERPRHNVSRDAGEFVIGPSAIKLQAIDRQRGRLTIAINETTAPIPRALRGMVQLDFTTSSIAPFALDSAARHHWQPISPLCDIHVSMQHPQLDWHGQAYLDCNWGEVPLEEDIEHWSWSRHRHQQTTYIQYDVHGHRESNSLFIAIDGDKLQYLPTPPLHRHRRTGWLIPRALRSDGESAVLATLEDTPFYCRSRTEITIDRQRIHGIHETVSMRRFKSAVIQAMLHCRMPRARYRGTQTR
jgi:carotenoid 1,2-hydratase